MAVRELLRRRQTTPARTAASDGGSTPSLPTDILLQTCRRMWGVGAAFAALWAFGLLMNNVIARFVGLPPAMAEMWPMPGNVIALTGLGISILMSYLAGRLSSKPDLLLDIGSAYMVITCLLVGLIEQWHPMFDVPRPSWIAIVIVMYASIVPNRPLTTLGTGLVAASMGPLGLVVTAMRGVDVSATPIGYLWSFVPNYLAAFFALVPVRVIRGLGQQVKRAEALGSYRLEEQLGKGGMGEVYRASHQMLARPAAVKLIRPQVLGETSLGGARVILERFRREAEAAASLRSPHTINLYDFGVSQDGTFFFVMELLDGIDLESLVERFGPLPPARAVHLLTQACHSLDEAHARGLVHRDIKPSNIFACRMGLEVDFVKVLDFGLVKDTAEGPDSARLTAPDATAGTPAYIAPEIVRGDAALDYRVDIYALGCVAYWLVTGRLVFEAPNALQLMFQHAHTEPAPPSTRTELPIPRGFDDVVLSCLAKRPVDRPCSAAEVGRRLVASLNGERWTVERAERWWQRHRPEESRPATTMCDMTLTKGFDAVAEPRDTPAMSTQA